MTQMPGAAQRINALTQEQRESALDAARKRIAGAQPQAYAEPSLDDFLRTTAGRFPRSVVRVITALSVIMLVAAFLPSAMRLHQIGKQTFEHAITHAFSIYVAAICIVLMAEVGQVIFSLAAATTAETRSQRWGLRIGAFICTAIALVGNAEIVRPWAATDASAFVWLETFAPPILVLITAQILKSQMLHSIERRHEAQSAFVEAHNQWQAQSADALHAWQSAYEHAHEHTSWMRIQANALRDALRRSNARSSAVLREITDDDWRALILREIAADAWYDRAEQRALDALRVEQERTARVEHTPHAGTSGGERTGATDGNVREVGGAFVGACPDCGAEFSKPTYAGAVNALSAHMGRWCAVRNAPQPAGFSTNGTGE